MADSPSRTSMCAFIRYTATDHASRLGGFVFGEGVDFNDRLSGGALDCRAPFSKPCTSSRESWTLAGSARAGTGGAMDGADRAPMDGFTACPGPGAAGQGPAGTE